MFIDNPVGSGYSYGETDDDLTTTNDEIAEDLYVLMKDFLSENQDFEVSLCVEGKYMALDLQCYNVTVGHTSNPTGK